MKSERKGATKSPKSKAPATRKSTGFTEEERAAMKDRIQEMKEGEEGGDNVVLAKIAGMTEPDRTMGKRIHSIIRASAPSLVPRLWYGMPAYTMDGKVVCHFQPAYKFKTRYATLGFSDKANLDEGDMWPNAYAVKELTAVEEAKISALVKKAVS